MIKLTKREKFLLILMFVALLVYVGIFLLQKPLDEERSAAEATLTSKQNEVMNIDATIRSLEKQELTYEELVNEVAAQERIIGAYVEDEVWNNRMIAFLDDNYVAVKDVVIDTDATYMDPGIGVFTFKRFQCKAIGTNDNIIQLFDDINGEEDLAILDFTMNTVGYSEDPFAENLGEVVSEVQFTVVMGMAVKE